MVRMNAKEELLRELKIVGKTEADIKRIAIKFKVTFRINPITNSIEDYNEPTKIITSINELDFNYHDEYGIQEIYGYILLKDQSWFERHEYDGSEWWEYKKAPTDEFLNNWLLERRNK